MVPIKNTINNEVSPKYWPFTFNILEQLQFCWVVMQSRRILQSRRDYKYKLSEYINNNAT